jgi:hypothetical protein
MRIDGKVVSLEGEEKNARHGFRANALDCGKLAAHLRAWKVSKVFQCRVQIRWAGWMTVSADACQEFADALGFDVCKSTTADGCRNRLFWRCQDVFPCWKRSDQRLECSP